MPRPLLLAGTTRTGREVAAHVTRLLGDPAGAPWVFVACSALPVNVSASVFLEELAREAQGGTLFLDEIEALSPEGQAYVLHLVECLGHQIGPITRLLLGTATDAAKLVRRRRLSGALHARLGSHVSHLVVPPVLLNEPPRVWIVRRRTDSSSTEPPP